MFLKPMQLIKTALKMTLSKLFSQKDIIMISSFNLSFIRITRKNVLNNIPNHFFFLFLSIYILLKKTCLQTIVFNFLKAESTLIAAKHVQSKPALGISLL